MVHNTPIDSALYIDIKLSLYVNFLMTWGADYNATQSIWTHYPLTF